MELDISMDDLFGMEVLKPLSYLQNHSVVLNKLVFWWLFLNRELGFQGDRTAKSGFWIIVA